MTSGIIEILIEDTGVQAAVGQSSGKYKVYPVVVPQDVTQPFITVFQSAVDPVLAKQCAGELDFPKVTVVGNAKNFRDVEVMMERVRAALDNKSSATDAGYTFNNIYLAEYREGFDEKAQLYVGIAIYAVEQVGTLIT